MFLLFNMDFDEHRYRLGMYVCRSFIKFMYSLCFNAMI